jgi:hypothetical protein
MKAKEAASNLATSTWNSEDLPRPRVPVVESKIKVSLVKQEMLEKSLADNLWTGKRLADSAREAYESQLKTLDISADEQFQVQWSSRVTSKVQLHAQGLENIEDKTLRDQLSELLQSHIALELVPLAAKRAKTRGLLKSPRHKVASRLAKLQTFLSTPSQLSHTMEELGKFHKQAEVPQLDVTELKTEKSNYLKDMAKKMTADEDAARLFLCLQIILFGSHYSGVLYATGKFAPKIFKIVKPKLLDEDVRWLEEAKDSIKAGNTPDEVKVKMRSLASNVSALT